MPRRRRQSEKTRLLWSAILSLVGHAVVVLLGVTYALLTESPPKPKARPISIRTFDAKTWAQNRGGAPIANPRDRTPPKGQVVDVAPGNNREDPNARYLAETSNQVKKETRAREQSQVYSRAAPKNSASPQTMPASRGKQGGREARVNKDLGWVERFSGMGGAHPRLSEMMQQASLGSRMPDPDSTERAGMDQGENQTSESDASLTGGGAPNDDLRDVAAGDGTYLNTREWQYAAFFNRVKQAVSAKWDPNGKLRAKDPRGNRMGLADRVTLLTVTLRADGSMADCFVARSSGLDELDVEAVQAFERAQPFPNPPAALFSNGLLRFNFGFTVTNEPGGLPRMFHPGLPR